MLYLEDYLEMIEHLPQELKDRFTEIRELDLQVQNASDRLDDRVRSLFQTAKRNKSFATPDNPEFDSIRKEYYKALEDADEKVHQATQMYDLVDRYLRRLDQELHKFKMELEADNAGITEVLEKRSLELDTPLSRDRERDRDFQSQKENRFSLSTVLANPKSEKKSERKSSVEKGLHSGHASGTSTPTLSYSLGHVGSAGVGSSGSGAGAAAIAAAASQAIAATQQMQQGRRTASLKASYDAINLGMNPQEFNIGKELLINPELQQAAQQAMLSTLAATAGSSSGQEQKRNKRKSQHTHSSNPSELLPSSAVDEIVDSNILDSVMESSDWAYDVNEPRYCTCNQVSYGDMVACDNPDCPIEWFHYGCVNLDMAPKGKWYCPECSAAMRRRGRR